jgi:hypothetical protein
MHPHIATLLKCIDLEEKEQANRYQLDQSHTLKQLKAEGLALHPIIVTRRTFGYADYRISFKLTFHRKQICSGMAQRLNVLFQVKNR